MRLLFFGLLSLCWLCVLQAQECQPDPGPPIFFEDFGSGSNPGVALESGTTSYTYGSTNTGSYVVSNTTSLDVDFWHDGFDHTEGDTNGYMLIFNAAQGPTVFYQKTFNDLCPNTDYIFSAWITNIALPIACIGAAIKPNVRFTVKDPSDNSTQFIYSTGEIFYDSFLTWEEYAIRFRTDPGQTSVLIQLVNNANSGCGNDLAIDDLRLSLCNVQQELTIDICDLPGGNLTVGGNTYSEPGTYFDELPVPNSCNDTLRTTVLTGENRLLPTERFAFCQGDTLEYDGRLFTASTSFIDTVVGGNPDCPFYQPIEIIAEGMQAATQNITLCNGEGVQVGPNTYFAAGTYVDSLSTDAGCDSIVITNINTGGIEVQVSPPLVELDQGQSVQLMSTVSASDMYTLAWQPAEAFSCQDCPDPVFRPAATGSYQLIATDILSGCRDSAMVQVIVEVCENIYIPNAFSPNRDNMNDHLEVFAEECFTRLVSWHIFDRWGGLVYVEEDQSLLGSFVGWDGQVNGQAAAQGVYGYQLILERGDGTQKITRGEVVVLP